MKRSETDLAPVIRNQQVVGSNPTGGSKKVNNIKHLWQCAEPVVGHFHSVSPLCHHLEGYRCEN